MLKYKWKSFYLLIDSLYDIGLSTIKLYITDITQDITRPLTVNCCLAWNRQ